MLNRVYPFDKSDRKRMYENQCKRNYKLRDKVDAEVTQDVKDLIGDLLEPNFVKRIDITRVCDHQWFPIDQRIDRKDDNKLEVSDTQSL